MPALSVDFSLPPERALAFFRSKGLQASFDWRDMQREEHDRAFTVAKLLDMDLLNDVRQAVEQAIAEGKTAKQFRDELTPLLQAKGWWGQQEMTDPETGEQRLVQLGSARRLQIIYDTNLSTSYAAGRWQSIVANATTAPYLLYNAVDDDRTRELHRTWDNTVLRWDDAWWQTHYPPNGWRCRCSVIQLSERDLRKLGKSGPDSAPPSPTREWINPRTGEVRQTPDGIDPGWDYHPGRDSAKHLATQALEKIGAVPAELGAAAYQAVAPAVTPELDLAFGEWFDQVIADPHPHAQLRHVGALTPNVIERLTAKGLMPESATLSIRDEDILHARRDAKDQQLPDDFWHHLPSHMRAPDAILLDTTQKKPALLYVHVLPEGHGKTVVVLGYELKLRNPESGKKERVTTNLVRSGKLIMDVETLRDATSYELLWGGL